MHLKIVHLSPGKVFECKSTRRNNKITYWRCLNNSMELSETPWLPLPCWKDLARKGDILRKIDQSTLVNFLLRPKYLDHSCLPPFTGRWCCASVPDFCCLCSSKCCYPWSRHTVIKVNGLRQTEVVKWTGRKIRLKEKSQPLVSCHCQFHLKKEWMKTLEQAGKISSALQGHAEDLSCHFWTYIYLLFLR